MHVWHSGLLIGSAFYKMNTMTNDREEIARHYLCSIYVLPVGKDFSFHTSFTTSYSNFTQFISLVQGIAIMYTHICMQAYWIWKPCGSKELQSSYAPANRRWWNLSHFNWYPSVTMKLVISGGLLLEYVSKILFSVFPIAFVSQKLP